MKLATTQTQVLLYIRVVQLLPHLALLPGRVPLDASDKQISRLKFLQMARIDDAPDKRTCHACMSGPCDHVLSPYALRTVLLVSNPIGWLEMD